MLRKINTVSVISNNYCARFLRCVGVFTLISKRLIACNLSLNKLKIIHRRDPHSGIQTVFSEFVPGSKKPRVTKSEKIINKVVEFLNSC